MDFPILYKDDRVWIIRVEKFEDGGIIHREYGKINGKQTRTSQHITTGKNRGKKNSTTPYEQACCDATSLWNKQQSTHLYSDSIYDDSAKMNFRPMLAKSYENNGLVKFPCYVQPKFDGVRLLVYLNEQNDLMLKSRTGKNMDNINLEHIKAKCLHFFDSIPQKFKRICLDGEIYSHTMDFEEIVSKSRTSKLLTNDLHKQIQYHVYDIIHEGSTKKRNELLDQLVNSSTMGDEIKIVETIQCDNHDQIMDYHLKCVRNKYEGVMIRDIDKSYEQKRSNGLRKYKTFMDAEFLITNMKEGKGNDSNTAILECRTSENDFFWVRPTGDYAYRKSLLHKKDKIIGKLLTVQFQEYTTKGIPRFPVGKSVRDYE